MPFALSKNYNATLQLAHNRSSNHPDELLASEQCGCFQCCQTFPPAEIQNWIDERAGVSTTALCPRCGIDSVIGFPGRLCARAGVFARDARVLVYLSQRA